MGNKKANEKNKPLWITVDLKNNIILFSFSLKTFSCFNSLLVSRKNIFLLKLHLWAAI